MYLKSRCDTLIPPYRLPRRALGERWKLRIQPLFWECVAFLCERKGNDATRPGGTAFFVELDDDTGRRGSPWTYLVTALHNLEESKGRTIYVRVNTLPGVQ